MKSVWAIDLGSSAVKAVKMVRSGSVLVVQGYDVIPLGGGSVEMPREELIRGAIGALASRQRLRADGIFLAIPGKGVLTKFISLPPVEESRIPEIVNYEARQQIPFDLDEVIWRYQKVKEVFAPGEPVEISLVAARKENVVELINALGDYGRKLAGVQVSPLALYNFIKYDQQLPGATVIVDIGSEVTDLVVASKNGFWPRGLHIAGNSINRALEENFKIPVDEAESIKQNIAESKFRKQIMDLLQPIYRELIGEIQRSLGYYKSLAKDVRLDEILLLGNGLKVSGLERFIAENLNYNVRKVTELQTIQLGRGINPAEFSQALPGLGVALGLGVQALGMGEVKLNLLPDEFVMAREISGKKPIAVAALLLFALGFGFLYKGATNTSDLIKNVLAKDESQVWIDKAQQYEKKWREENAAVRFDTLDFYGRIPNRIGFPERGLGEDDPAADTLGLPRDFWLKAYKEIRDDVPEFAYLRSMKTRIVDPAGLEKEKEEGGEPDEAGAPEAGAPEAAGGPAAGGGLATDPTAKRIVITIAIETESHRGLNYLTDYIDKLKRIKLKPYKTAIFQSVKEMPQKRRHEIRNGLGEVIGGTERAGFGELEAPVQRGRGGDQDKVKADILRKQRTRYLVVQIRCVAKTLEDIKAEKEEAAAE
ncbi:MAG: type IV pilus assembly protein PilM [Planctomycetes bacterium]|nr:type IV pilus assembly protein PilM [Planctomycetota bacterium]